MYEYSSFQSIYFADKIYNHKVNIDIVKTCNNEYIVAFVRNWPKVAVPTSNTTTYRNSTKQRGKQINNILYFIHMEDIKSPLKVHSLLSKYSDECQNSSISQINELLYLINIGRAAPLMGSSPMFTWMINFQDKQIFIQNTQYKLKSLNHSANLYFEVEYIGWVISILICGDII
ncbi:hypothetical protein FF38_08896 [Lucilia cuprina]|uniref:Uncharacterized protein n=1 Tax=Lucilia cuprina TaxID=7375 RepID=A0A0L0BZ55_LUCCU|nr:hypothetical protein FF38_08896 [Lucilia cuprina]